MAHIHHAESEPRKHPEIASFENVVFLRPHHIGTFIWNSDIAIGNNGDPEWQLERTHAFTAWNAKDNIEQILAKKRPSGYANSELEYLCRQHLKKTPGECSEKELRQLLKMYLSEEGRAKINEILLPLSKEKTDLFLNVWNKPDSTPLVFTPGLDRWCTLPSKDGFIHCSLHLPDPRLDTQVLVYLEKLRNNRAIDSGIRDQITVQTAKENPADIVSVTVPLGFFRDHETMEIFSTLVLDPAMRTTKALDVPTRLPIWRRVFRRHTE